MLNGMVNLLRKTRPDAGRNGAEPGGCAARRGRGCIGLPPLPRRTAGRRRCRTSRGRSSSSRQRRGSASPARRRARACTPPACRSPTRPATGCGPGWGSTATLSTTSAGSRSFPWASAFPGQDAKGGDLPPRRECAPAWLAALFAAMPQIELMLAVGSYAHAWHLGPMAGANLTETVAAWRAIRAATRRPDGPAAAASVVAQQRLAEAQSVVRGRTALPDCGRRFRRELAAWRLLTYAEKYSNIRLAGATVIGKIYPMSALRGAIRKDQAMVDRLDRKILQILQEDATVPVAEIGRRVGLSTTPCWRRIQKLEEDGVITGRVALLDPKKVNTKVTAFVSDHHQPAQRRMAAALRRGDPRLARGGRVLPHGRAGGLPAARRRARHRGL